LHDRSKQGVNGRAERAFTPVFDGLCPAMTGFGIAADITTHPHPEEHRIAMRLEG